VKPNPGKIPWDVGMLAFAGYFPGLEAVNGAPNTTNQSFIWYAYQCMTPLSIFRVICINHCWWNKSAGITTSFNKDCTIGVKGPLILFNFKF